MYVLPIEKCKELDKYTIEKIGIPSIVLMENAATEVVSKIINKGKGFLIVCGTGNNGGDGLAIARKLIISGKDVKVIIISEGRNYSTDFLTNFQVLKNIKCHIDYIKNHNDLDILRIRLKECDVLVDCILGVGLNRNLNDFYVNIINEVNGSKAIKVSVDVPSGLNSNTGKTMGKAVKADITYTFEAIKLGFLSYDAYDYLGKLEVLNIGIPDFVKDTHNVKIVALDKKEYSYMLKKRNVYGHKGSYGRATIFAGSKGYTGAAYISTEACVKTGTGLTTLVSSEYVQDILSQKLVEAMTVNISDEAYINKVINNSDVIAFGPGIKSDDVWDKILENIINNTKCKLVIDAEGINILSKNKSLLRNLSGRAVLTPHPGEMARLIGESVDHVEGDRINVAKEYAKKNNIILVLKGYKTVITDGEWVYINCTGDSKMASGGMGDCLTGIITSLIAQKHSILESALLGAYIHGAAGDILGRERYSVTASEVIGEISKFMREVLEVDSKK